jgi:hypothetical protein
MARSKVDDGRTVIPTHSQQVVEFAIQLSVSHSGTHRVRFLRRQGHSLQLLHDQWVSCRSWTSPEVIDFMAQFHELVVDSLYLTEGCQLSLLQPED